MNTITQPEGLDVQTAQAWADVVAACPPLRPALRPMVEFAATTLADARRHPSPHSRARLRSALAGLPLSEQSRARLMEARP